MANTVKLKRSAVPAKVPATTDLQLGELAVNTYDGKLYLKKDDGTESVVQVGGGAGSGDVVGPSSATDNALVRFDTTTGKLIQNSVVIVDDTGSITGVNALTTESLVVNNNATIGSSNTDTLEVLSRITSDLEPNTNNAKDIGSSGRNWRDGFFGRTLHTVNLELTGTTSFDGSQGTSGQVLTSAGTGNTPTWTTPTVGTVTSVAMTVPTGLSISGTPITTSGTFAVTLQSGYSIPTTTSQANWDSAFTERLQWDGGSTNLVAATGRTSLGATTVGGNFFTLTNPSAIRFTRINADNTVSALDAATFRTAIGAGTSSTTGTVTSVSGTGTVNGLTLTGTVTSSGSLTLGGNLSITADMIYDNFTATASQTTFTSSQTYTASKIQVLVNGVMMINGADVTVSGGTSVVMAFALTAGDRVTLIYPI